MTPSVRARVSRACNECRKRKDRCNGARPTCDNCVRTDRACSYWPSKKRGLRTGYVRALETLLGLLLSSIHGADPWLSSLLGGHETQPPFQLQTPAGDTTDALLDAWRAARVSKRIDQLLAPVDDEDGAESNSLFDRRVSHASATVAKALSNPLPMDIDASPMLADGPADEPLAEPFDEPVQLPASPITASQPARLAAEPSLCYTLPTNWQYLLNYHFAATHCWLPMSQKHHLLRSAYSVHNSAGPDPISPGDWTFLTAVLAYASFQSESQGSGMQPDQSQVLSLSSTIMGLLPNDSNFQPGHIRALLILTLVQIYDQNEKAAWSMVGRAAYAITCLEDSPFKEPKRSTILDDDTKRTILCCIVLEAIVASWVRARPYFQRSDLALVGNLQADGMEEWEPWQPIEALNNGILSIQTPGHVLSIFNHVTDLAGLLIDLLRLPCDGSRTSSVSNLYQRFREWKQCLSAQHPTMLTTSTHPHLLNLQLFSASICEAIKTEEMLSTGVLSSSSHAETCTHLREHGKLLHEYIQNMGPRLVPPTSNVYLSILCLSLNSRAQLQLGDLAALEDIQGLRQWLLELNNTRVYLGQALSTNILPNLPETALSLQDQVTEVHHLDSGLDMASSSTWNAPAQPEPSLSTALLPFASQEQPGVPEDVVFDPMLALETGEMSEDGLFNSLADLDSADWYARDSSRALLVTNAI
ncbi:hypothetical protein N0V83_004358 [Neocucurbitaria cava]|uniref:Zn(2)-C6 fungal-type domain-containing protein n=1 Tax=Neocucurbitaria cava TaxID=798079 RepID=A0A9W8Y919_9PLEO|nr:hypothetical protein N0V83_004358 [Neocucurbitaria cava]